MREGEKERGRGGWLDLMLWPGAAVLQVNTELMEKLSIITEVRSSFSGTGSLLSNTANLGATHKASQRERSHTRGLLTALLQTETGRWQRGKTRESERERRGKISSHLRTTC